MGKRIIWLRAVNVGGAQLPMAELRAIMTQLGATGVHTYIQSGNAVCVPPDLPAEFDRALEQAIQERFGFYREVISRTPTEVSAALAAHPFEVVEPKYSYLSFLLATPTPAAIATAHGLPTGADRWQLIGRELHLRYDHGAGQAELNTAALMHALGVPGTARNLNTVRKMIDLARD